VTWLHGDKDRSTVMGNEGTTKCDSVGRCGEALPYPRTLRASGWLEPLNLMHLRGSCS
jgi:hypothetical protein